MIAAILYFFMGSLFMFFAFYYAENTIWNIRTIVFTAVATFDFGMAIQFMSIRFRLNQHKK